MSLLQLPAVHGPPGHMEPPNSFRPRPRRSTLRGSGPGRGRARHGAPPRHGASSGRAVPPLPPSALKPAAGGGERRLGWVFAVGPGPLGCGGGGGEGRRRQPLLGSELWPDDACGHGGEGQVLGGGLEAQGEGWPFKCRR